MKSPPELKQPLTIGDFMKAIETLKKSNAPEPWYVYWKKLSDIFWV